MPQPAEVCVPDLHGNGHGGRLGQRIVDADEIITDSERSAARRAVSFFVDEEWINHQQR